MVSSSLASLCIRNAKRNFLLFGRRRTRRRLRNLFILFGAIFSLLHFIVLPKAMGYYNDDCYLDNVEIEGYRHLVRTVTQIYDEFNQTHWLDDGTLLGYHRNGDILSHDGDADISRLIMESGVPMSEATFDKKFKQRLADFGMTGNVMRAKYEIERAHKKYTFAVDLTRWKWCKTKSSSLCLNVAPNERDWVSAIERGVAANTIMHSFNVLPVKRVTFLGRNVTIPHRYMEVLKQRYPYTLRFSVPYKWKCWLPWARPPTYTPTSVGT